MQTDTAPAVTQTLGDAGVVPEIELAGRVWKLGHPTQRAKAELERLVVQQATREVTALRGVIDPQSYQEMVGDLRRAVGAREYATFGAGWSAAFNGPDGSKLFVASLLRERHPDATEADAARLLAERGDEVSIALAQVAPPFCRELVKSLPATDEQREATALRMAAAFTRPATSSPTAAS